MLYRCFFKRFIDVTICLIGLPFFVLIFVVFAPIIWLSDFGPVFFIADRLGKKGKIFKMYKFRSMRVDSPNWLNSDGSTYNGKNDPRVTRIGKFMRKTSLDETPQLLNVLLGQMSIIGPRAFMVTKPLNYDDLDDKHKLRLEVLPGISGYSQAYFRNSATVEEKVEHDVYYVEHLSFMFDVKIFFKTILSVVSLKNIYVSR